jgi:hypothetical protein
MPYRSAFQFRWKSEDDSNVCERRKGPNLMPAKLSLQCEHRHNWTHNCSQALRPVAKAICDQLSALRFRLGAVLNSHSTRVSNRVVLPLEKQTDITPDAAAIPSDTKSQTGLPES